eukprot:m.69790 g.69790  ORF g.69790 m.69790 type:complete len:206 (+) comp35630_c0_seq5:82-699(+)
MLSGRLIGLVSRLSVSAGKCRWNSGPYHFDTHHVVKKLQAAGYTPSQAEELTAVLHETVSASSKGFSEEAATKGAVEILSAEVKSRLNELENNLRVLESRVVAPLKDDSEKISADVVQLRNFVKDEVTKLKSGLSLDHNLEKSRQKEELSKMEEKILANAHRVDIDMASIKTTIETNKLDTIKYLAGTVVSMATLLLGYWRFIKM